MPAFSRAEGGTASSSLNGKKKSLNLPIILKKKVNFAKIKNKEELNQWTEQKVTDMLPFEDEVLNCLLYTSPSPRDQRGSRMPSSA